MYRYICIYMYMSGCECSDIGTCMDVCSDPACSLLCCSTCLGGEIVTAQACGMHYSTAMMSTHTYTHRQTG